MGDWDTRPRASLGDGVSAQDLVPGDAASMRSVAARLARVAAGAEQVGALLRRVDAGEWVGESGEAFRGAVGVLPAPYGRAGVAFGDSARALTELADVLERGRGVAREAVARWEVAQEASARWSAEMAEWDVSGRDVSVHLARTGLWPPLCADPGEGDRAEARRALAVVQEEVAVVAARTASTIAGAAGSAPSSNEWGSVVAGLKLGVTGPVSAVWGLTPMSGRAGESWSSLAHQATHPWELPGQAWRAFVDDPVLFLASMVPAAVVGGVRPGVRDAPAVPSPRVTDPFRPGVTVPNTTRPQELWSVAPQAMLDRAEWLSENAAKIADHAWVKHAVRAREFPWVKDVGELADYVAGVMSRPAESFTGLPGRGLFWDEERQVIVIQQDPPHTGSVFPTDKEYYDNEVRKARRRLAQQSGGSSDE